MKFNWKISSFTLSDCDFSVAQVSLVRSFTQIVGRDLKLLESQKKEKKTEANLPQIHILIG